VESHNFSELSPIPQVVRSHNFQPRINIKEENTPKEENNNNIAGGDSVAVAPILAALRHHGPTSATAARKLVAQCRAERPECTSEEIVQTIAAIAASFGRSVKNPVGVLLTQVPGALPKDPPARQEQRVEHERTALNAEARRWAVEILADPKATERDREMAHEVLEQPV